MATRRAQQPGLEAERVQAQAQAAVYGEVAPSEVEDDSEKRPVPAAQLAGTVPVPPSERTCALARDA